MTLRFALLGAGRIGTTHALAVAASGMATIAVVADARPAAAEALAAGCGARVAPPEAAIGDPTVDAVLICTPTDTHAELIEAAVAAGKAVFCEKPIDLDAGRVARCLERVRAAEGRLMVGFNRRFDPSFAALERRLAAGEIGRPESILIVSRDPAPPPIDFVLRSGGLFRDMTIHDLDMARWLLGEAIVEVHAVGACLVDPAIGAAGDWDSAAVTLRTASGRTAQISNSRRAVYGYDQRIEVLGERGLLRAGNQRPTSVELADAAGFRRDPLLPFFMQRYAEAYRLEMVAFAAALREGRPLSPSGADGLAAQRLADAATQSATSGRVVRLAGEG